MLRAAGLDKRYGDVHALRGVDLSVDAGEVVALLGRNGAGKSTMLSIIAGLLEPDAGSVVIDGVDSLADPAVTARTVGIAPQDTGIYRVLTVRENLEFFGEIAGMAAGDRRRRVAAVAEQLGLTDLMDRRATALSGGEARRLHTACALVHAPKLLLLDEPTVGADVGTRKQLVASVRELAADGAAVVYTTHYLPEVEALDADIVIIDEGQALARGRRSDLVARFFEPGVDIQLTAPVDLAALAGLSALAPQQIGDARWRLNGELDLADLAQRLGAVAAEVVSIEAARPDLETVFLAVTGASLSDEPSSEEVGS